MYSATSEVEEKWSFAKITTRDKMISCQRKGVLGASDLETILLAGITL